MRRTATFLFAALSLATACARPPAPPPLVGAGGVAQVVLVAGDSTLKRAGSPAWAPVVAGASLAPGDRLWTSSGSATIRYATGEMQQLHGGTIIEIR